MAVLKAAVVLVDGVFTGAMIAVAWERVPAWRDMPLDRYRPEFKRTLRRMDPAMPALALISAGLGIWLAVVRDGRQSASAWIGSILLINLVAVSVAFLEPVNNAFRRDDAMSDEQLRQLRRRWERLHFSRSAMALLAFLLLVAAAE